jgi:putative endonuclease
MAMRIQLYYVYILTNASNKVLYTGITNNLERRCYEHLNKLVKGFTQKYNVYKLVYFEIFDEVEEAIFREKQIKGYSRAKKVALINRFNSEWNELPFDGKRKTITLKRSIE